VLARSTLWRWYEGALVGPELGCAEVIVPLARLTVFTWLSSLREVLNILAAASLLEKRGGRIGRD
jgi:hypothetical protein